MLVVSERSGGNVFLKKAISLWKYNKSLLSETLCVTIYIDVYDRILLVNMFKRHSKTVK